MAGSGIRSGKWRISLAVSFAFALSLSCNISYKLGDVGSSDRYNLHVSAISRHRQVNSLDAGDDFRKKRKRKNKDAGDDFRKKKEKKK